VLETAPWEGEHPLQNVTRIHKLEYNGPFYT
jgi:hypothetical protein